MISKIRELLKKYERYIPPVAIFGGFILDSLTLGRIDQLFGQILLGTYLLLIGVFIILMNLIDANKEKFYFLKKNRNIIDFLLFLSLGNVFSGFTLFYFQSAGSFANWIFVIIMFCFLVSTEYFKKHYTRIFLQLSIFYLAIFSYLIFLIPVLIKKIGAWIFILSGVISLLVFYCYLFIFKKILKNEFEKTKKNIIKGVLIVFVMINSLYFLNMIPPVPLSSKVLDIFHYVERDGGNYKVLDEEKTFFDYFDVYKNIHIKKGESVYFFSSIFSPTKLNTKIVHEWQYRDEKGRWITSTEIPFTILGGKDAGYRGYSVKSGLTEGRWRVNVKTVNGQIIGRKVFKIIFTDEKQTLVSKIK